MSFAWWSFFFEFLEETRRTNRRNKISVLSLALIFNLLFMMNNRRYFVCLNRFGYFVYACLCVFVWCAHELNETTTAKQRRSVHEITTQTMEKLFGKKEIHWKSTKQSITSQWVKWKQSSGWNLYFSFFLHFLTCRRTNVCNLSEIFVLSHRRSRGKEVKNWY